VIRRARVVAWLAVLTFALTAASAHAQGTTKSERERWVIGYTLGFNRSDFLGALGDSIPHSQVGFGLGLYALFPMRGPFRLRSELLLSNRGGGWDEVVYGIDYTDTTYSTLIPVGTARRTVDLTYIELPVMLSLPLRSQGTVIPHIEGGASAGLRILGGFRGGGTTGDEPINPDDANRFELRWLASAGVDIYGKRGVFGIDLRYGHGISEIYEPSKGPPGVNEAWTLVVSIRPSGSAD
jgi:hypothetical protein